MIDASPLFDGVNKPEPVVVAFTWNHTHGRLTIGGPDGWTHIPTTATFNVTLRDEHAYTQLGSTEWNARGRLIVRFQTGGLVMHLRNPMFTREPDAGTGSLSGHLILDREVTP